MLAAPPTGSTQAHQIRSVVGKIALEAGHQERRHGPFVRAVVLGLRPRDGQVVAISDADQMAPNLKADEIALSQGRGRQKGDYQPVALEQRGLPRRFGIHGLRLVHQIKAEVEQLTLVDDLAALVADRLGVPLSSRPHTGKPRPVL